MASDTGHAAAAGGDGAAAEPDPAAPVPLAAEARPLVAALSEFFPDIGGTVTDAVEARRVLAAAPASPFPPPRVGSVSDRFVPGPPGAPDLRVRCYLPEAAPAGGAAEGAPGRAEGAPASGTAAVAPRPTVVFFHGGGWSLCSVDTHDATARGLCRAAHAAVVSVDYRLAPEDPFPAAVDDAYAALRWAAAHRAELGGEDGPLVLAGDSAGGNLAAVSALTARDGGGPPVAQQVLIYPAVDGRDRGPVGGRDHGRAGGRDRGRVDGRDTSFLTPAHGRWFREQYLGAYLRAGGDPADPRVSPLLAADLCGLPPAVVVTAGHDPLCAQGRAYAARLRGAGVPVVEAHFPAMFHGFFGFPELLADARAAQEAVTEAIASTAGDRKNSGATGGGAG
ncbi:alpha/beta hydrolase [Streptomyces flavofungini]|uniref:alpha/beta hydrolase n=1 Tax=Streptomyces flavofungini TaxID=68200 RepID=UPI0025B1699D|nr:alpha/beta hydrolase [Streptomyces flavofungini]WJV50427.1 alpha/beta hydrolase [Streptomyces flavofungini]